MGEQGQEGLLPWLEGGRLVLMAVGAGILMSVPL